MYLVLLQTEL